MLIWIYLPNLQTYLIELKFNLKFLEDEIWLQIHLIPILYKKDAGKLHFNNNNSSRFNLNLKLTNIVMLLVLFHVSHQLNTDNLDTQQLDGDFGARFIRRNVKKFLRSAKASDYGTSSSSSQSANAGYSGQGQSGNGAGYSSQGQSGNSAGYSNQGQSGNGAGYSSQGQSGAGAGYSNQGQSGAGAGYSNQGQSGAGAGYSNQGQSGAGAGYSSQGQSGNGAGYSKNQQSGNAGYSSQQKTTGASSYSNAQSGGNDGYGKTGGDSYGDDQGSVTWSSLFWFFDFVCFYFIILMHLDWLFRALECPTISTGPLKMMNPRTTTATRRKATVK